MGINKEDIQYLVGMKILFVSALHCLKSWSGLIVCNQLELALFLLAFQDILLSSLHHAAKEQHVEE